MDAVELPAETITSEVIKKCATPISDDHDDKFGVPSLEELGKLFFIFSRFFVSKTTLIVVYIMLSHTVSQSQNSNSF